MFRLLYATLSRKEHTYIEFMQIKNTLKEMEYLNSKRRKSPLESQFRAHVITLYKKDAKIMLIYKRYFVIFDGSLTASIHDPIAFQLNIFKSVNVSGFHSNN